MIVDAQLHEPPVRLPWPQLAGRDRFRLLSEVARGWMEAVGVDAALLFPIEERDWARELAAESPHTFAWVAMAGAPYGAPASDGLEQGAVAVRAILGSTRTGNTGAADLEYHSVHTFPLCASEGVPVFVYSPFGLELVREIVTRHPDTIVVLDHLGQLQPPIHFVNDPWASFEQLLELAEHDNLYVKLSGVPSVSRAPYPFRDVWTRVRAVVDAFGANRLLWGSDISRVANRNGFVTPYAAEPGYAGDHTYAEALHFLKETDLLTADERERILGRTARTLLQRWPT